MTKKMKEFRGMNQAQLNERLSQIKMELVKFNTQVATGTAPKSPGLIRQAKRNVARILTILNSRQVEPVKAEKAKAQKEKPKEKPKAEKVPASKPSAAKDKPKAGDTIKGDNAESNKNTEALTKE